MPIGNAIAQFGQNVGSSMTNSVNNAMQRRDWGNAMVRQQEKELDAAEKDYVFRAVSAIATQPDNVKPQAYAGFIQEYERQFPGSAGKAPKQYSPEMFNVLMGRAGVSLPKPDSDGNTPMSVKEWEYFQKLPPDQKSEFLRVKRTQQIIDLGDKKVSLGAPGQPNTSYKVNPKPTETPQYKADVKTAEEQAKLGVEKEANKGKATVRLKSNMALADRVIGSVDKAIEQSGFWSTGLLGQKLRNIGGTDAKDLTSTIETVKANLGFQELQKMREMSPTGGALGSVAVQELVALQSTVANLDNAQNESQLDENLMKVKHHLENWKQVMQAHHEEQYGGGGALKAGHIEDGYTFLGGDPANPSSWRKAE